MTLKLKPKTQEVFYSISYRDENGFPHDFGDCAAKVLREDVYNPFSGLKDDGINYKMSWYGPAQKDKISETLRDYFRVHKKVFSLYLKYVGALQKVREEFSKKYNVGDSNMLHFYKVLTENLPVMLRALERPYSKVKGHCTVTVI